MGAAMVHDGPLREAVAELYRVFQHYPAPTTLEVSPRRDGPAILRALQSAPLRELAPEALLPYAGWAETTVYGDGGYRHYLPRIFELALDHDSAIGAEPAVMADKLDRAGWKQWPGVERHVVRGAFTAAWNSALQHDQDRCDALPWLIGLATIGDVADALDVWRASPSPHAGGHFARLVAWEEGRLWSSGMVGGNGFWEHARPKARRAVMAWLHAADARRWLADPAPDADQDTIWTIWDARKLLGLDPGAP